MELIEADALGARGGKKPDRDRDQPEGEVALPDRSRHCRSLAHVAYEFCGRAGVPRLFGKNRSDKAKPRRSTNESMPGPVSLVETTRRGTKCFWWPADSIQRLKPLVVGG